MEHSLHSFNELQLRKLAWIAETVDGATKKREFDVTFEGIIFQTSIG